MSASGGVLRVDWVPGTDRLLGTCHCGAQHLAEAPADIWQWLLAHPDGHRPQSPEPAGPAGPAGRSGPADAPGAEPAASAVPQPPSREQKPEAERKPALHGP